MRLGMNPFVLGRPLLLQDAGLVAQWTAEDRRRHVFNRQGAAAHVGRQRNERQPLDWLTVQGEGNCWANPCRTPTGFRADGLRECLNLDGGGSSCLDGPVGR